MLQFSVLSNLLSQIAFSNELDDRCWNLANGVEFSMKVTHNVIDNYILPHSTGKIRWNNILSIKVNIFSWRLFTESSPY